MDTSNDLEKILLTLLQKNIEISLNKTILKSGKFILFKIYNYSTTLYFKNPKTEKKLDSFLIPIPFKITELNSKYYEFSFKNKDLNITNSEEKLLENFYTDRSKYYNNSIIITKI